MQQRVAPFAGKRDGVVYLFDAHFELPHIHAYVVHVVLLDTLGPLCSPRYDGMVDMGQVYSFDSRAAWVWCRES